MTDIDIRKVAESEVETLLAISKNTFFEAFEHLNNPVAFLAYTNDAFTVAKLSSELNNPSSAFYFARIGNEIAGYMKLNFGDAQTELAHADALEVERIYVIAGYQGKQIGKQLINYAIDIARQAKLNYVWLGVWEHNTAAIRFYQRSGFVQFSSHYFMLGTDRQTDILMRKEIQ